LKANLFENIKAVAFKFLVWNLTGIKGPPGNLGVLKPKLPPKVVSHQLTQNLLATNHFGNGILNLYHGFFGASIHGV
jgi:hypothetical protein